MPAEVLLNEVPMGVAVKASRKGETASIQVTGFLSSEDGQELITHLEQFPSTLLMKAVGTKVPPANVDTLLAIVRRDKTATVYVNELQPQLISKVGQAKEKGEPVFMDDIMDITAAELGVEVPADAGVVIVFSWGWRKGLFYDFGPLGPDARPREFDLPAVLGELYARLLFQQRYRITDDEWAQLFGCGWFPFAGLGNETIGLMLTHLRAGWDLDELMPRVAEEVRGKAPSFLQAWLLHPALAPHAPILERAVGHFLSGDHVSCAGLLYPQIEGILRSHPVGAHVVRPGSLLMPHRFEDYLKEVYLPRFNPAAPAEGQAPTAVPPQKSAAIAILVIHQHVGVTLSVERARPGGMRGGRVWFAGPPSPPTATIPSAWGQVMRFLDEGVVVAARAVNAQVYAPGTDELFLAELPADIAGMLLRFSRSARKALPLAADDAQLWHSFVIGAFRARAVVESRRLVEWFVHEGWERDTALELNLRFFELCRLLSRYAEEVAFVS